MPSGLPGITAPFFIRNALTDPAFHMELVLDALKRALPALPAFLQYKTKPMWEKNLNNKALLLPKEKTMLFLLHSQPAAAAAFSRIPPNTSYS